MRYISAILTISLSMCFVYVSGQPKIVTNQDKNPIPFVNIGIKGKSIGSVSNINGEFELAIPDSLHTSIITFSSVGYEPLEVSAKKLNTQQTFTMKVDTTSISEVEVMVSKKILKEKILGNTTESKSVVLTFSSGANLENETWKLLIENQEITNVYKRLNHKRGRKTPMTLFVLGLIFTTQTKKENLVKNYSKKT